MQVQRADPAYRRRVLRTLGSVAVLLLLALAGAVAWLQRVAAGLDPNGVRAVLLRMQLTCAALIALSLAALGAHLVVRGRRIAAERRFPPRDVRSVRDTPIREGDAAVSIGRTSQALGAALLLLALGVAAAAGYAFGR